MQEYEQEVHELILTFKEIYKSDLLQQFVLENYGEMVVLSVLRHHQEKNLMPSEIGRLTQLSPARVAAILKVLEKKNYIKRELNLEDRRKISVQITAEGLEKQSCQRDKTFNAVEAIFLEMGHEEVEKLLLSMKLFQKISSKNSHEKEVEK